MSNLESFAKLLQLRGHIAALAVEHDQPYAVRTLARARRRAADLEQQLRDAGVNVPAAEVA